VPLRRLEVFGSGCDLGMPWEGSGKCLLDCWRKGCSHDQEPAVEVLGQPPDHRDDQGHTSRFVSMNFIKHEQSTGVMNKQSLVSPDAVCSLEHLVWAKNLNRKETQFSQVFQPLCCLFRCSWIAVLSRHHILIELEQCATMLDCYHAIIVRIS